MTDEEVGYSSTVPPPPVALRDSAELDIAHQPDEAASGAPMPGPAAEPHPARWLGLGVFFLGEILITLAYFWALAAFHTDNRGPQGSTLLLPTAAYASWGMSHLFFLLALLVLASAGWAIAGRGTQLYRAGIHHRPDRTGILVGLGAFCAGIGLIVLVFLTTTNHFISSPGQVPPPPATVGWALSEVMRVLLLAYLALGGSLFAGRGCQLFLTSYAR